MKMDITNTKNGVVKWYSTSLGYGFITGEDQKEYFFHHSEIKNDGQPILYEGNKVTFNAVETERGLQAKKVIENKNKEEK